MTLKFDIEVKERMGLMVYKITKVYRHFKDGTRFTIERTINASATFEQVIDLAKRRYANIDELTEELDLYGITFFKGYMIEKY